MLEMVRRLMRLFPVCFTLFIALFIGVTTGCTLGPNRPTRVVTGKIITIGHMQGGYGIHPTVIREDSGNLRALSLCAEGSGDGGFPGYGLTAGNRYILVYYEGSCDMLITVQTR